MIGHKKFVHIQLRFLSLNVTFKKTRKGTEGPGQVEFQSQQATLKRESAAVWPYSEMCIFWYDSVKTTNTI